MAKLTFISAVAVTILAGATAHASNLVVNGGFETGDFTGWVLSGNLGATVVNGSYNAPHTGLYAAQLGAVGSDDILSQTLSTVSGATYSVSFWHIYNPSAAPIGDFSVHWDNTTIYGPIASTNPPSPQTWTQYSFLVTGTGSDTLSFYSRNDPSYHGLDDVAVTGVSATPVPAALPLFATGLGVMSLLGWRRKRKAAGSVATA